MGYLSEYGEVISIKMATGTETLDELGVEAERLPSY